MELKITMNFHNVLRNRFSSNFYRGMTRFLKNWDNLLRFKDEQCQGKLV